MSKKKKRVGGLRCLFPWGVGHKLGVKGAGLGWRSEYGRPHPTGGQETNEITRSEEDP